MQSRYNTIACFMNEYFPAYSQQGQLPETIHEMDRFYAPNLCFDDGVVTSREQWYSRCLSHPQIQDKISVEHLFIDERQLEAGGLLKTQLIARSSGQVLVEIKMNVLYSLESDENNKLKIIRVRVYLESDPGKAVLFFKTLAENIPVVK
jgi:hypothetical protein